jgi:TatA/E family protein of Tat protein translocase
MGKSHLKKIKMTTQLLFLGMPGGTEWIFIILAVLILFGAKKIPEMMKGVGKGIREFNDAKNEDVKPATGSKSDI